MTKREIAERVLDVLGIQPQHAAPDVTVSHGHPGVCCCLMEQCCGTGPADNPFRPHCNVNPVLVVLAEAEVAERDQVFPTIRRPRRRSD